MSDAGPELIEPIDVARIAELLAATPWLVAAEVGALGPGLVGWRPAAGEWCALEIVGHLVEAERRGFAGRIETMLSTELPTLDTWDQPAVAAARRDCERSAEGLLDEFIAARDRSVRLVRALQPADLERAGIHPVVGRLTVGEIVAEWVHHDRSHVEQLLAVASARVRPQMGNARRFGDPSPHGGQGTPD